MSYEQNAKLHHNSEVANISYKNVVKLKSLKRHLKCQDFMQDKIPSRLNSWMPANIWSRISRLTVNHLRI